MRRVNYVDDLLRDLRYAGRNLRRSPALPRSHPHHGARHRPNTAVFSVVNAVLLKPLSYRDPDRIVTLTISPPSRGPPRFRSKSPFRMSWTGRGRAPLRSNGLLHLSGGSVVRGTTAEYARLATVSPEFFRVFGVEPIAGRFFTPEEMKQGGGGAAMISYAYWQSHFGGDPNAPGQTIAPPDRGRSSASCRRASGSPTTTPMCGCR